MDKSLFIPLKHLKFQKIVWEFCLKILPSRKRDEKAVKENEERYRSFLINRQMAFI